MGHFALIARFFTSHSRIFSSQLAARSYRPTHPTFAPAPASCNWCAILASASGIMRSICAFRAPVVNQWLMSIGRHLLGLRRCFEHDEAMQGASFHIERTYRKIGRASRPAMRIILPDSHRAPTAKSKSGSRNVSQKRSTPDEAMERISSSNRSVG